MYSTCHATWDGVMPSAPAAAVVLTYAVDNYWLFLQFCLSSLVIGLVTRAALAKRQSRFNHAWTE